MSEKNLQQQLAALKKENAQLKAQKGGAGELTIKVSQKGAVSVYGLGRFPVTLYKGQWEKLLAKTENIKSFIAANTDKLATKS